MHFGCTGGEVDPGSLLDKGNRPEQPVGGDAGVAVVNLVLELGVDRPDQEVESDEPERPLVLLPVLANVAALHDPHVGVVDQPVAGGRRRAETSSTATAARDRPFPLDVVDRNQATEVADRRGFIAGQVIVDVDELTPKIETTRDRLRGRISNLLGKPAPR